MDRSLWSDMLHSSCALVNQRAGRSWNDAAELI
jgi:hypothetical protein